MDTSPPKEGGRGVNLKIQKKELQVIPDWKKVKSKKSGVVVEIVSLERTPTPPPTKKLNAIEYVYLETGEIAQYQKAVNKADSLQSVRRSLVYGRDLINCNFSGTFGERMYTFTYRDNMTDLKRLCDDLERVMRKIKKKYGDTVWVTAIEPQERGAWHAHMLIKSATDKPLWIDATWLYESWGNGYVSIEPLHEVDNVGAYLSGYLANMAKPDGEVTGKDGTKYKKGARLHMYPSGMRIFRCSRNCKKPEVEELTYKEAKEKVRGATRTYAQRIEITDESGQSVNEIQHEYYNTARRIDKAVLKSKTS